MARQPKQPKQPKPVSPEKLAIQEKLEVLQKLLQPGEYNISWSAHSYDLTISEIRIAKIGELKHKPDKLASADGKLYSPPVFLMQTSDGRLTFKADTLQVIAVAKGAQLSIGPTVITIVQK